MKIDTLALRLSIVKDKHIRNERYFLLVIELLLKSARDFEIHVIQSINKKTVFKCITILKTLFTNILASVKLK